MCGREGSVFFFCRDLAVFTVFEVYFFLSFVVRFVENICFLVESTFLVCYFSAFSVTSASVKQNFLHSHAKGTHFFNFRGNTSFFGLF